MNSKIAISTVYRIIEKLYKLEIVQKSATNDGKSLYELSQNGHKHYIICTKCKKIVALKVCPIPDIEKKISNDTGFHITGHKYELYGECKDCQLKDNS